MISYRFKRRAFLSALSGGVGLKIMLRNLELSAATARSPARLLVTHWPVGIVAGSANALWAPNSGSVGGSVGLRPFADAGLGPDMTVLRGISTPGNLNGGGSHEGGTVVLVTGGSPGGTRTNRVEGDDAFAVGPSFDQFLLQNSPALQGRQGASGFANSIVDSRTDFAEVSTKCLSYSNSKQAITAYSGVSTTENIPLLPVLSPLVQCTNLFANFVPTSAYQPREPLAAGPADALLTQLAMRRSVLDFAAEEISQLRGMVPSAARSKLDNHYFAIQDVEQQLTSLINGVYPGTTGSCAGTGGMGGSTGATGGSGGTGGGSGVGGQGGTGGAGGAGGAGGIDGVCSGGCRTKPPAPPAEAMGAADPTNGYGNSFGRDRHERRRRRPRGGRAGAHGCPQGGVRVRPDPRRDVSVVPGQQPRRLQGDDAGRAHRHLPAPPHQSPHRDGRYHRVVDGRRAQRPAQFLFNVQRWYYARHAENLASWKETIDGCGNSLLDFTTVPFVTEVRATGHERSDMPAMIIGGKRLGFTHDVYRAGAATINQFWGTIAQAYGVPATGSPLGEPIPGLWTKPA